MKEKISSYAFITVGVLFLHVGFYFFLQPINLITGGVMGISLLIGEFTPLTVGVVYLILNIIALGIGGLVFGKEFFMKTIYATLLAPALVSLFELFKVSPSLLLNDDLVSPHYQLLIASLAGGVLIGTGLGIVLRNNATTGGIDVFQKMINKYFRVPFSVAVYLTDGIIILIGMLISFESGLFAIISIFLTTVMIDKTVVFGRSAYAILIITDHGPAIKEEIYKQLDRGVTKANVIGGYSNKEKEMVITTVTKQELYKLKDLIHEADPLAFSLIISTKEVLGDGFHRDDLT